MVTTAEIQKLLPRFSPISETGLASGILMYSLGTFARYPTKIIIFFIRNRQTRKQFRKLKNNLSITQKHENYQKQEKYQKLENRKLSKHEKFVNFEIRISYQNFSEECENSTMLKTLV